LKLNAIKGRGVKKDFWDIVKLLEFYSMDELFHFYSERYSYDYPFALKKSIAYFDDAENNIGPQSLDDMDLGESKENHQKWIRIIIKEIKINGC
jgi:hypothetical protein